MVGIGLFASAFSPVLVAIALVTQPFETIAADVALVVVCAAPALLVGVTLRSARRLQDSRVRFLKVRRVDRDVLTFLASFVLPISAAFLAEDAAKWAATGVLLVLLLTVYLRAQLFQLNPVLTLLGFRAFEVESERGIVTIVLSRRRSLPEGSVLARRFSDELYIDFERQ
ncbi:MAG: hypothetical protein RI885_2110 [Actinomycetota bacterium]